MQRTLFVVAGLVLAGRTARILQVAVDDTEQQHRAHADLEVRLDPIDQRLDAHPIDARQGVDRLDAARVVEDEVRLDQLSRADFGLGDEFTKRGGAPEAPRTIDETRRRWDIRVHRG